MQIDPSLSKAFLIFYLITTINFTNDLVSKQMKKFLEENRIAKHFLGFITMFVLINTVAGLNDQKQALLYTVLLYTWFIFSTKLDIHWNMIIIALLFLGYLRDNDLEEKHKLIIEDTVLSSEDKSKILEQRKYQNYYLLGGILGVTLLGTVFYSRKKEVQYGGGFDAIRYFLY
jgi:hypothetical protein